MLLNEVSPHRAPAAAFLGVLLMLLLVVGGCAGEEDTGPPPTGAGPSMPDERLDGADEPDVRDDIAREQAPAPQAPPPRPAGPVRDGEAQGQDAQRVLVLVAPMELAAALSEVTRRFTADTGTQVQVRLAGGARIAAWLRGGMEADVVITDHPEALDELAEAGTIHPAGRALLAEDRLVLAAPAGTGFEVAIDPAASANSVADMFAGQFAMPSGRSAVGQAARQALEALGWWDDLSHRLLPAGDPRSTAAAIQSGEADAGIIGRSAAMLVDGLDILADIPPRHHDPVRYTALTVDDSPAAAARDLLEHLLSPDSAGVFEAFGFIVPGD